MSIVKEAADRMLKRGDLSQHEYDLLKSKGIFKEGSATLALGQFLQAIKPSVQKYVIPIGALIGAGVAARELIVDPIRDSLKLKKSFESMPTKVPQLVDKDPQQIRDYFDVIKTFSPRAASNPLVAGALVNKMMEFGGVDHKLVQDLSSLEAGGVSKLPMVDRMIESSVGAIVGKPKDGK